MPVPLGGSRGGAPEAGARVGGLNGREPSGDMVLAAAPGVYDALHDLLAGLDADRDPLG
ncbi:MAG: hypothetical protein ACR2NV_05720 [Thermoleophilaceae bacterium]